MGVGDEKRAGFLLLAALLLLMLLSVEYCPRATSLTVADDSNSTTTTATTPPGNAASSFLDHDHEFKVEWLIADDMLLDFLEHPHYERMLQPPPEGLGTPVTPNSLNPTSSLSCGAGISFSQCLGEVPPCTHTAGCYPPGGP